MRPAAAGVRGPVSVLLCDDQAMIRQALSTLIDLEADLHVVAQVASGPAAVAAAATLAPDVAIMDVQLAGTGPGTDGIAATRDIRRVSPATRVIIVTTFGRPGYLQRAMAAGAVGFMVKDAPADQLIEGIRRVAAGLRVVDPALAAASLQTGGSPLSERETELLIAARGGGTTATIARQVYLSEGTVRNHLSNAMGKLGAVSRAEAVRIATDNGWLA